MKAIETRAIVSCDGKLIADMPSDIEAGEHSVVIVINNQTTTKKERPPLNFPVDHYGSWPSDLSLSREDIYGDDGR